METRSNGALAFQQQPPLRHSMEFYRKRVFPAFPALYSLPATFLDILSIPVVLLSRDFSPELIDCFYLHSHSSFILAPFMILATALLGVWSFDALVDMAQRTKGREIDEGVKLICCFGVYRWFSFGQYPVQVK
ncbi:hypothetical protein M440DRAFT_1214260 [Trichoderma longibrachiatum ATCC 18648]|uniref:Uncharacterized protein n=1 Tax=Trichoderma longibrachiatum ATCC 18648 TaxID=983965 RepID=A0A2T4C7M1_TRILO|nr:hypothetical protein M440DRAFT_1214260 [Trichoderma longibrachiatum ATCC 18648]